MTKRLCLFCDGYASVEAYRDDISEKIEYLLAEWKICTKHAHELVALNDAIEKRELERAVA